MSATLEGVQALSAFQAASWNPIRSTANVGIGALYTLDSDVPAAALADRLREALVELDLIEAEFARVEALERPVQRLTGRVHARVEVVEDDDELAPELLARPIASSGMPAPDEPLVEAHVLSRDGRAHRVAIVLHPLVGDLSTCGLLLAAALTDPEHGDDGDTLPYLGFAAAHDGLVREGEFDAERAYWRTAADDVPIRGRLLRASAHDGGWRRTSVELGQVAAGDSEPAFDLPLLTHAAMKAAGFRLEGEQPVALGVLSDARSTMGLDGTLGPLTHVLPDREAVDLGATLTLAARRSAAALAGLKEKEGLPPLESGEVPAIVLLTRATALPRPLVDLGVACEDVSVRALPTSVVVWTEVADARARLHAQWPSGALDDHEVESVLRRCAATLEHALGAPSASLSEAPLVDENELERIVELAGPQSREPASVTVVEALLDRARHDGGAAAVAHPSANLTYAQLASWTTAVAERLRAEGVRPGDNVGVFMEHGPESLAATLGAHLARAAYVPFDPDDAAARVAGMVDDAGVRIVLTQSHLADRAPGRALVVALEDVPDPGTTPPHGAFEAPQLTDPAYVLFTSGSSGRPKGVSVAHAALTNYLRWCNDELFGDRVDVLPVVTKLTFDACLKQLFAPLLRGAAVWFPARRTVTQPGALLADIAERERVGLNCVVSNWAALLEAMESGEGPVPSDRLERIFIGGERGAEDLIARTRALLPELEIWHLYGPTEATATATAGVVGDGEVTIGRPIAGARVYVVDARLRPVPVGTPGEICIAGPGVAQGYVGREDLTAERFVDLSIAGRTERVYRTGDRGSWTSAGHLRFLGRADTQVKVRGYRVELGEVEAAVAALDSVAECAVELIDDDGGAHLAAYVVLRSPVPTADLRAQLRASLPEYMIPTRFHRLDALPRLGTGKLDRRALRHAAPQSGSDRPEYVAPRGAHEQLLADVWSRFLTTDGIGVHDDFFQLGGHSLLLGRIVNHLRTEHGLRLSLRDAFRRPTIEGMAAALEVDEPVAAQDARSEAAQEAPLSFAQESQWLVSQLNPGNPLYNVPLAYHLEGAVDVAALDAALGALADRHAVLRTRIALRDGSPVQVVDAARQSGLLVEDAQGSTVAERRAAATATADAEALRPFDLAVDQPMRCRLLRIADEEHLLLATLHHVVWDGWSRSIWDRDLSELYAAHIDQREPDLPVLTQQYADVAAGQRERLDEGVLRPLLEHWEEVLDGAPHVLELPFDRPRPAVQGFRGDVVELAFADADAAGVQRLASATGSTPFMVLAAAFATLLSRWSGQSDMLLGVPYADRDEGDVEELIGVFLNTLVLRADLDGDPSFVELLSRVRDGVATAFAHREAPFEAVVRRLRPARDLGMNPLVQVTVQMLPERTGGGLRLADSTVSERSVGWTSRFELDLTLRMEDGKLAGWLTYATDLFDRASAERLGAGLLTLLRGGLDDPDAAISCLPLLTEEARQSMLSLARGDAA